MSADSVAAPAPATERPAHDKLLDAGEASCGELLILVVRAMKTLTPGQVLEVVGYDTGALEDLPAWCRLTRNPLLGLERSKPAHFFIRKREE